jgi:hypothetical protein
MSLFFVRYQIDQFMMPSIQAGQVEIWPASTCDVVVTRAEC